MGKTEVVFKFTGTCVGSSVFAGKKVCSLGSTCGRKIADMSKSNLSSFGGMVWRVVPRKFRKTNEEHDGIILQPAGIPDQSAPQRAKTVQESGLLRAEHEQRSPAPAPPHQRDKSRVAKSTTRKPKPHQVENAVFGGATEKFLFTKATADLEHSDMTTRSKAVGVLGNIRHELSSRTLAARYPVEPSAHVRKSIVSALADLGFIEAISTLERALNDGDAAVRLAAVMGVYRLGGAAHGSALIRRLNDQSAEVRRMIACCVGWMGQARLAVELEPLLSDRAVRVRRAAAEAMGYLGNREVVPALIECLNDSDHLVCKKALEATERITGKEMTDQYLGSEHDREQLVARWRHWWKLQATA